MSDPGGDSVLPWDEVVDVICVGDGPGVTAYGCCCAAEDLDVLHVAAPAAFDADAAAYLAAMTEDLPADAGESEPAVLRAVPAPLRRDARGRPDTLDTFVGQLLREWSARCAASPTGVLFTHVPGIFTWMRDHTGQIVTIAPVDDCSDIPTPAESFAGLVYDEGVIAGAVVDGPAGPRRVRAESGLAFGLGAGSAWPDGEVALVSRPYARFARLEVLAGDAGDD